MYEFIDVTEMQESTPLPSEALKINGEYIENLVDGYRTLYVTGREALSSELETYETGARDGSILQNKRFPARIITVGYQLIAESNEAFRTAYNALGGILNVEEAKLIFNDENDKYYVGTPSEIGSVEPGRNAVTGEFEIYCADPFKYSIEEFEATADLIDGSILLDYGGTHKSYPRLIAEFLSENDAGGSLTGNGDCGYVAFFNESEKIIQLGNPDELDGDNINETAQTLISSAFEKSEDWGSTAQAQWARNTGVKTSSDVVTSGNVGIGVAAYASSGSPKDTSGTLLSKKATTQGAPIFYYSVSAKATGRTANSVKLVFTITASLKNSTSYFGTPYALKGSIYVGGAWRDFTVKKASEYWKGQTAHTVNLTVTITGLSASTESLTGMKFKVVRTDTSGAVTGTMPETSLKNLAISPYVADTPESYYLSPSSYGTGDKWHGVSITRTIPADSAGAVGAKNFMLSYTQKFVSGATSQIGAFYALLVSGSGSSRKIVAGAYACKGVDGTKANLNFFINDEIVQTVQIDVTGSLLQNNTIKKTGNKVEFSVAGSEYVFNSDAITDEVTKEVTFGFLAYGSKTPLSYNGLYRVKFVKNNCDTWKDVPNKFSANDVVEADCKNGEILLNGIPTPSLGALGNDWEEFFLTPGLNQIGFSHSDWVEEPPTFKVRYREVFL